jgi:hypothetical protein
VWIIGVVALLWNGIGAFDYTMTEMRNPSYMKAFTPEQLAYYYSFPAWAVGTWAISVWGGVAGSLALLLRKRWAATIFVVSLITMVITFFYNFVLSNGMAVMGGQAALILPSLIVVVDVALIAYSRSLARKGVLQ